METDQPYAFTGDNPLNATDPLGLRKKLRRIASNTEFPGIVATVSVVGRGKTDRTNGEVRIQFEIQVKGAFEDLNTTSIQVGIIASGGKKSYDFASPIDPVHPQATAHTTIALKPGTHYSVYGEVQQINGNNAKFVGSFTAPSESVYDKYYRGQGPNGDVPGFSNNNGETDA